MPPETAPSREPGPAPVTAAGPMAEVLAYEKTLTDAIAAVLQARLSWPTAEACAADVVAFFRRQDWVVVER